MEKNSVVEWLVWIRKFRIHREEARGTGEYALFGVYALLTNSESSNYVGNKTLQGESLLCINSEIPNYEGDI